MRGGEHASRLQGVFEDVDAFRLGQDDEFVLLEGFPYIFILFVFQESLEFELTRLKMLDRRLEAGDLWAASSL